MCEKGAALVTGGSRGIGRAICKTLAEVGYPVVITCRSNREAAEETLALVGETGSDGEILCFDVADAEASEAALAELIKRRPDIEVLVNNAGVAKDSLLPMMSRESWDIVVRTSLDGFFNVTRPVVRRMIRKRRGSIVTISSVSGITGNRGQVNYSAAKAGVIGASRALSQEVARLGIRVNVVAPGLIDTDMIVDAPVEIIRQFIPMNRIGRPEEVAAAVRFLCSDDASYITGHVLSVNGGMC